MSGGPTTTWPFSFSFTCREACWEKKVVAEVTSPSPERQSQNQNKTAVKEITTTFALWNMRYVMSILKEN